MALITDVARRFRSYRTSKFAMAYLCILLVASFYAASRASTLAQRERPRITAVDSALTKLVRTLSVETSDRVDPLVRALAEQRRDMETELNSRLSTWMTVRLACSLGFLLAVVVSGIGFVRHMLGSDGAETERPTVRVGRD